MTFKPHLLLCLMSVSLVTHADNRALLVGIDDYEHINKLIGSKQDVENMRQFIQSEWGYQPAQIRTLTDAEATQSNILSVFDNWLIRNTRRGDKVLFYYSGHGTYVKDNWKGDESDGYDEALCPVNTSSSRENLILDDEIHQRLQQLKGRQVTLIIDACHSGTMTKSVSFASALTVKMPIFKDFSPRQTTKSAFTRETFVNTQPHVVAYSAVAPDEVALVETNVYPHEGVFTRRFIEGIRDKYADSNDDGKVSHQEVLAYTRRESQAYCDKNRYQCQQGLTPQLEIKSGRLDQDIRTWAAITDAMPPTSELIEPEPPLNEDLQLEILPAYPQPGQRMRVRITSKRNGYVLLFDASRLGGTQTLKHLFDERYNQKIIADKPLTIPDSLSGHEMIAKSPGERVLVALFVNTPDDLTTLEQALPDAFEEAISKPANTYSSQRALSAQNLSQQLTQQLNQQLWRKEISQNWSISSQAYEIR